VQRIDPSPQAFLVAYWKEWLRAHGELSRRKFPDITCYQTEALDATATSVAVVDDVVMNGLFTDRDGRK
jgi:hypothetical protein